MQTLQKTRRKQAKQNKHRNNTKKLRETHNKQQEYRISSPGPDREYIYHIFIRGGSWAGYPVFMLFVLNVFLEAFLFISVLCLFNVFA